MAKNKMFIIIDNESQFMTKKLATVKGVITYADSIASYWLEDPPVIRLPSQARRFLKDYNFNLIKVTYWKGWNN